MHVTERCGCTMCLNNLPERWRIIRTDPKAYRGNLRLITTDLSLSKALWRRIEHLVPAAIESNGETWDAVGLNECIRLAK